jgi:hypothetical protein
MLQKLPITAPSLRLDTPTDRSRLSHTVQQLQPILLVLDPLIRLATRQHRRRFGQDTTLFKYRPELFAFLAGQANQQDGQLKLVLERKTI